MKGKELGEGGVGPGSNLSTPSFDVELTATHIVIYIIHNTLDMSANFKKVFMKNKKKNH